MEADVLEVGGLLYIAKVAAVAVAQAQIGASGAKHVLPEVGRGWAGGGAVDDDLGGG